MNILFVCHRFPFPPDRGGKIRPFNFIRHFSQNHTVTVATLAHSQQEQEAGAGLGKFCSEVISEVVPNSARWPRAAAALLSSRPSSEAYFWSPRLRRRIEEKCQKQPFDVIWVHCAFVARYVLGMRASLRVLDYGDIDSGKWFDYAQYHRPPASFGYALEARKLRHYEKWLSSQFDQFAVTAPGELLEFQKFNSTAPCTLIPNGVDSSYFRLRDPLQKRAASIVFLGRMDYFPNVSGVQYFVSEIFPLIRQRVRDAQFQIVGSNPLPNVKELGEVPGVTVTGYVEDVRPYLHEASVSVIPLHIARGTQNKMLECMSVGVPVVATAEAARGVQGIAGRDFLVGSTTEEFASQVCTILQDQELGRRLSAAGRLAVETAHNWAKSMRIADEVLAPILRPKSAQVGNEA